MPEPCMKRSECVFSTMEIKTSSCHAHRNNIVRCSLVVSEENIIKCTRGISYARSSQAYGEPNRQTRTKTQNYAHALERDKDREFVPN